MKIGIIEVSGIEQVMFYRRNCFTRKVSNNGQVYWKDNRREKYLSDKDMAEIIVACAENTNKKVWAHGNTINVVRREKPNEHPYCQNNGYTLAEAARLLLR